MEDEIEHVVARDLFQNEYKGMADRIMAGELSKAAARRIIKALAASGYDIRKK
jgi:hypothetical protein